MPTPSEVFIRAARVTDAAPLHAAINRVASEKWFLATVHFSEDEVRSFMERSVESAMPHVVACHGDDIVGWCDVLPGNAANGFGHVGRLGMGVIREWRRQGVGRRLLQACLREAQASGLEKIELEVYPENSPAVRLYESFGFAREGQRVGARKLDGRYQDILLMALWVNRVSLGALPRQQEPEP
jgi:ribosomal protein S18 acetylase RimI-like enzyme